MEKNKYTAVVILNFNNVENTISCIDSLKKYNSAHIKLIVVDNGSTREGCVERLVNYSKNKFSSEFSFAAPGETLKTPLSIYTLVLNPSNEGYARGNNIGLRLAFQDEYIDSVLILNNDILFVEDIIPKLSRYYSNIKNCGCISPMLLNAKGEIDYCCARKEASFSEILLRKLFMNHLADLVSEKRYILKKMREPYPELIEVELTSGSCLFMNKQVLALMGGLDSNTFLYYEENIINAKLKQQMLHNFKGTTINKEDSYQNLILNFIDRSIFFIKI